MKKSILFIIVIWYCFLGNSPILIDLDRYEKDKVHLSTLSTQMELINLEYPSQIQPQIIVSIKETSDFFLVFDSNSPHDKFPRRVFKFSKNGKFIKELGYSNSITIDDNQRRIYQPIGNKVEVYDYNDNYIDEFYLEKNKLPEDHIEFFKSFKVFSNQLYYMHYSLDPAQRISTFTLYSYNLKTSITSQIYTIEKENSSSYFYPSYSVQGNTLFHHNQNIDKAIWIDEKGNVIDTVSFQIKLNKRIKLLPHLFSFYAKSGFYTGNLTIGNIQYFFKYDEKNITSKVFKYDFSAVNNETNLIDDIYKTGSVFPLSLNSDDKFYSIRYHHPDGSFGNFQPNSSPKILIFKYRQ